MSTLRIPILIAAVGALAPAPAHAICESELAGAKAATGDALGGAFTALVGCSEKVAKDHFPNLMRNAGDVGSLVTLALAVCERRASAPY